MADGFPTCNLSAAENNTLQLLVKHIAFAARIIKRVTKVRKSTRISTMLGLLDHALSLASSALKHVQLVCIDGELTLVGISLLVYLQLYQ